MADERSGALEVTSRTKPRRFLGIDFSGDHAMWSPRCRRSNVWIAEVHETRARELTLVDLRRVQDLPGDGAPFARLAALLKRGDYAAAGIDAPFALPERFMPKTSRPHAALLARVAQIPRGDRAFPRGDDFVRAITGTTRLDPPKPLRATELAWARRRVNVRSPLWCGARPGAPMTAACLMLLHEAQRPVWPWTHAADGTGVLCEAFPSAQAHVWRDALDTHVDLGTYRRIVATNPDARDAVLAACAATAIVDGDLVDEPDPTVARIEGWVAVHA